MKNAIFSFVIDAWYYSFNQNQLISLTIKPQAAYGFVFQKKLCSMCLHVKENYSRIALTGSNFQIYHNG